MSHKKSRRPGWETEAATRTSTRTSNPKDTWPLDRLLVILWMQNMIVLACTVVAILAVTR